MININLLLYVLVIDKNKKKKDRKNRMESMMYSDHSSSIKDIMPSNWQSNDLKSNNEIKKNKHRKVSSNFNHDNDNKSKLNNHSKYCESKKNIHHNNDKCHVAKRNKINNMNFIKNNSDNYKKMSNHILNIKKQSTCWQFITIIFISLLLNASALKCGSVINTPGCK